MLGWIILALCGGLGWFRVWWPVHLLIGAAVGAYRAWSILDAMRERAGDLDGTGMMAAVIVGTSLLTTAAAYWIGRGIRSAFERWGRREQRG